MLLTIPWVLKGCEEIIACTNGGNVIKIIRSVSDVVKIRGQAAANGQQQPVANNRSGHLLNLFLFPFCKNSSGKRYSLLFLPATPSSPSRTLEGLIELTRRPSLAFDSPRTLLPELQRYNDTVRCAALGAEVPGHRHEKLTQTLIVCLLQTHFFTPILDGEKSKG